MAVIFTYYVCHQSDGSQMQMFKNQSKAEAYAKQIKRDNSDVIKITRTAKGYNDFIYFI